ncbi:DNA gyrase inhibitor YacG [Fodinicurvata sp. EGI_FJ10296]|uniref:DNA gyrase inhibitor YacG n=1 Tax=Fodinicurvata sp. EGI_FJ10296 TaxID=3231908 RepID=UPI00345314D6
MQSEPKKRAAACPICGKAASLATRPFCSNRCRDVDLARWFGEDYRIPAVEAPDESDEALARSANEDGDDPERG